MTGPQRNVHHVMQELLAANADEHGDIDTQPRITLDQLTAAHKALEDALDESPNPSNRQDFRESQGMTECCSCGARYPDNEVPKSCKYCGTEDDWEFC